MDPHSTTSINYVYICKLGGEVEKRRDHFGRNPAVAKSYPTPPIYQL